MEARAIENIPTYQIVSPPPYFIGHKMVLVRRGHSASSEGLSNTKIRLINPKMSLLKLSIQYNRHTSIFYLVIWLCAMPFIFGWFSGDFSAALMHGQGTRFSFTGPLFNQSIRLHAMLNAINYQCRFEFRIYLSIRYVRSVHSKLGPPIHRMNEEKSILSSWRGRQNSIRCAD